VYGLGATLYCVLTGRAPFSRTSRDAAQVLEAVKRGDFPCPRAVAPALDRALEAVCLKAMAARPDDRYPTPRALADDVERWLAEEPVSAWRGPLRAGRIRWASRNRLTVAAAAAAAFAGLIGLTAVAVVQTRAQRVTEAALSKSENSRKEAEAVSQF